LINSNPKIDVAILDVNLGGQKAYPVADIFRARNIPFVLAYGYDDTNLPDLYPQAKNCRKPYVFRRWKNFW
jgi:hypothetical protein